MNHSTVFEIENMDWLNRDTLVVFLLAFFLRVISVGITSLTSLNTYSQADANGFANRADQIARTILTGSTPALDFNDIYDVWGAILSPFWIVPGPSRIYARVGIAILGAVAIYNVYVIVKYYHSRSAGAVAILPMLFYPSFLFLHAAILREAMILFGLTSATRLLLVPNSKLNTISTYAVAGVFLSIATLFRSDNLPVYLLILFVGAFLKLKPWQRYEQLTKASIGVGVLLSPAVVIMYGQRVLDKILFLRQARARGRTEYLGSVLPATIPEAIAFSWIGAGYFLFTPFPWMVSQFMDFVILFEGLGNFIYAVAAITGVRVLSKKTLAGTIALVVGIVVGAALYGLGTVNVGTAVRHRQMILWAIFLFGGIGLAEHIRIRFDNKST